MTYRIPRSNIATAVGACAMNRSSRSCRSCRAESAAAAAQAASAALRAAASAASRSAVTSSPVPRYPRNSPAGPKTGVPLIRTHRTDPSGRRLRRVRSRNVSRFARTPANQARTRAASAASSYCSHGRRPSISAVGRPNTSAAGSVRNVKRASASISQRYSPALSAMSRNRRSLARARASAAARSAARRRARTRSAATAARSLSAARSAADHARGTTSATPSVPAIHPSASTTGAPR